MGLFSSSRTRRAQRKAESKALKARAKLEAKLDAKERRKSHKAKLKDERKYRRKVEKDQRKTAKVAAKAQVKVVNAEAKASAAQAKAVADAKIFSPTSVRRYLTVARLVGPIVVPIVYRAAVGARAQITAVTANRAGVAPELLRKYSGHGATLSARIATSRSAIQRLADQDSTAEGKEFVAAMTQRLDNLAVAVDAAESMPTGQRRTAHQSIDAELSAIDADVLARLGVRS